VESGSLHTVPVAFSITASGGPFTWAAVAPTLPPGTTRLVGWKQRAVFSAGVHYVTIQIEVPGQGFIESTELFNMDYQHGDNDPPRTLAAAGHGWPATPTTPPVVHGYCFGPAGAICHVFVWLDFVAE
jgi:hypothetical protein